MIETTLYIGKKTWEHIEIIARRTGKTKQAIVIWALHRFSIDSDSQSFSWSRIKYQQRSPHASWSQIHLRLTPSDYEFFLDIRKIFKSSVSRLVAMAVKKYIREIIRNKRMMSNNYGIKNYVFSRINIYGVRTWVSDLGISSEILTFPYVKFQYYFTSPGR